MNFRNSRLIIMLNQHSRSFNFILLRLLFFFTICHLDLIIFRFFCRFRHSVRRSSSSAMFFFSLFNIFTDTARHHHHHHHHSPDAAPSSKIFFNINFFWKKILKIYSVKLKTLSNGGSMGDDFF